MEPLAEERQVFPGDARSVRAARAFVRDTLAAWGEDSDNAVIVVSELATNAVLHARSDFEVAVRLFGQCQRIEVADENSRLPVISPIPDDATSGRGLALVQRVAHGFGIGSHPMGKVVWAEMHRAGLMADAC